MDAQYHCEGKIAVMEVTRHGRCRGEWYVTSDWDAWEHRIDEYVVENPLVV